MVGRDGLAWAKVVGKPFVSHGTTTSPLQLCDLKIAWKPAQKFFRTHSPLSFNLHFAQPQCPFAGCDDEVVSVGHQNFSRCAATIDNRGRKYLQIAQFIYLGGDFCERT